MIKITDRQQEVFNIIQEEVIRAGAPPTLREIAEKLGISGTVGVMKHLDALERIGYIRRHSGKSRGIELVLKKENASSISPLLPIVGQIHAGPLHEVIENNIGDLPTPTDLAIEGAFWLRVSGESMIDAAIIDGDMVLIHPQPQAANGEIVAAMLNGEATLKRFFHYGDRIELRPENKRLDPIYIHPDDGTFSLIGVMRGLFRRSQSI